MEAAAAVERLWPGRRATAAVLPGGITNRNFRVDVDGESLVLRMAGRDTEELGIDRLAEHEASLQAAAAGVGPEVVRFAAVEGWLVTRFIAGRPIPPDEMKQPGVIARVAIALRGVHAGGSVRGAFDAHEVVDRYARLAESRGASLPGGFASARALSDRIRKARGPQPRVLCHNDLLNGNFLDDGRVRIIDWEYAGMGDRFFDLGNLSVNHGFSVAEDRLLLAANFGEPRPVDLAALRLMRFMSDFREAMWGVVQGALSDLDFDFQRYAADHFERLERAASEPVFEEYISAVRS